MVDKLSFTAKLADDVTLVLEDIERETLAFQVKSKIRCRPGCGQCCLKPAVDARPLELLPLARALTAKGEVDAPYAAAVADPDGVCVFYQGDPKDPTLGRCGIYEQRPSLCRLFGFAAVSRKRGPPELAACHWHKRLQPQEVSDAQAEIDAGQPVPLFNDFAMRLNMLAPGSGLDRVMPINRALVQALEKAAQEPRPS